MSSPWQPNPAPPNLVFGAYPPNGFFGFSFCGRRACTACMSGEFITGCRSTSSRVSCIQLTFSDGGRASKDIFSARAAASGRPAKPATQAKLYQAMALSSRFFPAPCRVLSSGGTLRFCVPCLKETWILVNQFWRDIKEGTSRLCQLKIKNLFHLFCIQETSTFRCSLVLSCSKSLVVPTCSRQLDMQEDTGPQKTVVNLWTSEISNDRPQASMSVEELLLRIVIRTCPLFSHFQTRIHCWL